MLRTRKQRNNARQDRSHETDWLFTVRRAVSGGGGGRSFPYRRHRHLTRLHPIEAADQNDPDAQDNAYFQTLTVLGHKYPVIGSVDSYKISV